MSKPDLRKQYLRLAYEQLNPTANDPAALEQVLVNWFCLKFNTTPNDPRLLGFRLDELILFRMMNEIHEKPAVLNEIHTNDEYEKWLQSEMGVDYKSVDQMVADQEEIEKEEAVLAESLPDRIETDFKKIRGE